MEILSAALDDLVDAHCHRVYGGDVDRPAFEQWCTEASTPAPAGLSHADTQLGVAVRRWCAPLLDLEPHADIERYLRRRAELGAAEANGRLLRGAGLSALLVDTGFAGDGFLALPELGALSSAKVREVVRLESVAEHVGRSGVAAVDFPAAYQQALTAATSATGGAGAAGAVAVKSVLAYRHGFDVDPSRPAEREVVAAASGWLDAGAARLVDPVLLRFVLWCGIDTGLPLQLHCGFGDRDLYLPHANPALLQPFLAAVEPSGTPVVLLHCYPYHREAGWLASVFGHVYADVGLTLSHVGARATAVLAEFCELAPFGKLLFSTDAYGLAELYRVGAAQFRHALTSLLHTWQREGALSAPDAERFATMIATENARRVYALPGPSGP